MFVNKDQFLLIFLKNAPITIWWPDVQNSAGCPDVILFLRVACREVIKSEKRERTENQRKAEEET